MTLVPLTRDDIDVFSITTNPLRSYSSSSLHGVTGSVYVLNRRSEIEKDVNNTDAFVDSVLNEDNLLAYIENVKKKFVYYQQRYGTVAGSNYLANAMSQYMQKVRQQSVSSKNLKYLDVVRFTPSVTFTSNTVKKLVVKENLMKHYRVNYPSAQWAYTNYNSLNFFTSSNVPSESALLYPVTTDTVNTIEHSGHVVGSYIPSGSFSLCFKINVRNNFTDSQKQYRPGTLLHLPHCYCLSVISGSDKDAAGNPEMFGLQLQLGLAADTDPHSVDVTDTWVFRSSGSVLKKNNWHSVVVTWPTDQLNSGTGSFYVDNARVGEFIANASTIAPAISSSITPDVLVLGNYWDGTNSGAGAIANYFASAPAEKDGLIELVADSNYPGNPASTWIWEPSGCTFTNPLKAEVHDVCIRNVYMTQPEVIASSSMGPNSLDDTYMFYVPPFFTVESPFRKQVGDQGGILQTPFFAVDGTTDDPFNVAMSFGVAGHLINLENFVKDFASNVWPRLMSLTGSAINNSTEAQSANYFLYASGTNVKRNLSVVPCDDGNFMPTYELLMSESYTTKYKNDIGYPDYSLISLDNMVSSASLIFGSIFDTDGQTGEKWIEELLGPTPEVPNRATGSSYVTFVRTIDDLVASGTYEPGVQGNAPLTIYQRTKDPSSNQVTFFDISNMFYGDRISPGTLTIKDSNMSGSAGALSITLKDDGYGNLYRADALTKHASWCSVGNVFYDEGIVLIKSPHLYFFGKDSYELSFKGERNIHVLKVDAIADRNMHNSSSNPNWSPVKASSNVNDPDDNFVYVSGIRVLDENLNVVMKAELAQPVVKRFSERYLFRLKLDF
jgi:hypothetical protein